MTGLLVLTHPGTALAADKTSTDSRKVAVLHPTIAGTDGEVRYSLASLAGGGVQVSFVYVPDEAAGETSGRETVQAKEFTLSVDAKAVATQTVTDDGGTVVPAADDSSKKDDAEDSLTTEPTATSSTKTKTSGGIVEQDAANDSTEVTLKASTEGVATVWVLPQQAPAAANPDDQPWVSRTWHSLIDKITGDEDSIANGSGDDEDAGDDDTATAAPTDMPTTSPSSTPTSSSSPSSSSPSSSSTGSPSATATGSPSSTGSRDDEGDAEGGNAGDKDGDDTCVVTQGQLTTTLADDGTVNAPLEDGPSAAPTFSEEVQKKAAEQALDCGEGRGSGTGSNVREDQGDDEQGEDDATDTPTDSSTDAPAAASSGKTKVDVASGDWLSGISGDADERSAVEKLRGVPAEVATTWADASGSVSQLGEGSQFGADKWNKSLILALPPFPEGSSWEDTAAGKNDEYLRTTFQTAKEKWGDRDGQLFIEYGYEMNGYWMWWNARAGQEDAVSKAFARARSIQSEEFPKALLGVRFNHESNGYDGNSEDLIAAVKSSIDFIGASYYNAYPAVSSKAEFDERAGMRDGGGGPKGIGTWLAAAKTAGLPIEFGEWAESAKDGDSPAFIDGMHETFQDHAGPGAGQVFAESYFQINKDDDNWRITSGRVLQSAQEYGKQFSDVG
ncbi:hypothetical protein [Kineococcus sp. R86509]|uniref:hypothetical protein n=1 Tax=Kineococcus sp. R86509 TaxID=3093851 RepID=UPI0036D2C9AE